MGATLRSVSVPEELARLLERMTTEELLAVPEAITGWQRVKACQDDGDEFSGGVLGPIETTGDDGAQYGRYFTTADRLLAYLLEGEHGG